MDDRVLLEITDGLSGFVNDACPWLPGIDEVHDHQITRRHGDERGGAFYQDALRYAQSQWRRGKPAQALLQLDKAWMAEPEPACEGMPYHALVWILAKSRSGGCGYLGNPVRHFQHLASRMSGPRAELRSLRAWVCLHLAERVLPCPEFPRDGRQIIREGLWIPGWRTALAGLARFGYPREAGQAAAAHGFAGEFFCNSRKVSCNIR